jgi:hypothetical protein
LHVSGHTVERGFVRPTTFGVAVGVAISLSGMMRIGVEAGERGEIGASSMMPKYSELGAGAIDAGVGMRGIDRSSPRPVEVG